MAIGARARMQLTTARRECPPGAAQRLRCGAASRCCWLAAGCAGPLAAALCGYRTSTGIHVPVRSLGVPCAVCLSRAACALCLRGHTTLHSVPLSSPDLLSFRSPPFAFVFQPPSLSVLTPTPRLALEQPPTQEASFLRGAAPHAQRRFPKCGQHRMGTVAWLSSYRSLRRHCIHRTRRGVRSPPAVRRPAQVAPN